MSATKIKIKTDLEKLLYDSYIQEKSEREKLALLVNDLQAQIQNLQCQLQTRQKESPSSSKEQRNNSPKELEAKSNLRFAQSEKGNVDYFTDEEELAKETEWIRAKSRKKRKLNISLTPPQQPGTSAQQQKSLEREQTLVKKVRAPPPIIIDGVKSYQMFYDSLTETQPTESFTAKMMNGDCVKINAITDDSYRAIAKFLTEKDYLWHTYENKQARPIRVVVKKLHSSCQPDRIKDDLISQGLKIEKVDHKLSWKSKEPLNMFVLSFHNDEDVNKIYATKHILGCKIEIHPLKNPKLIPQCKRCQAYGHTHKYCKKEPRCVKCTGKHLTADCIKSPQEKPKCVHCGLPHPANYRGCEVAKEMQMIKNKTIKKKLVVTKAQQFSTIGNPDQHPRKEGVQSTVKPVQVTKSSSYAQAVKQGTQPSNLEGKINQILKFITTFDERLEKLESSTKTAALSNQKWLAH